MTECKKFESMLHPRLPFGYAALMKSSIHRHSRPRRPVPEEVEPNTIEQDGETYELVPLGAARLLESNEGDPLQYLIAQEERESVSFFQMAHLSYFLVHRVFGIERYVLTLFFYTHLTRTEIGQTLGLTEDATERIRLGGLKKLRSFVATVRRPQFHDDALLCA